MEYVNAVSWESFKDFFNTTVSSLMTRSLTALLIVLIGFISGKLVGKIVEKVLNEIELNKIIKNISGISISLEHIISAFVTYFIFFMSIIMALNQIGITTDVLNILSAAVMVLVVLSIFLGIKDFIPNFIAGMYIYNKKLFEKGDKIKFKDIKGKVIEITLIETVLETASKDLIYIPNLNFVKNEVTRVTSFKDRFMKKSKE